jgi:ribosomal protein S6--L-glutamate ligase
MRGKMRLHFIQPPKKRSAVLQELHAILDRRGHEVTESIPETAVQDIDAVPRHDLYVLKARTKFSVSVAGILQERGAKVLNPYVSCAMLLDKFVATAAMRQARIPTPRSWALSDSSLMHASDWKERLPLIVKPFDGIHSKGVRLVSHPDQLQDAPDHGPVLVQEFVEGCSERLKIHVVGERVFATCKPFSLGGTHGAGLPREVSDEVRDIALRCGKLFGVGLYGLDVLMGRDGPVVVDVNSFPGYIGVPGIATIIADYLEEYARGANRPELASPDPAVQASGAPDGAVDRVPA